MDKIFIRERINILDYDNKNQGLIYTSSDIDIEGGIINVNLESDVAGWHQLTFDLPAFIVQDGKRIQNPFVKKLFPLCKLQYTRTVKEGDEEKDLILYFIIQPQDGDRNDSGIVTYSYTAIDYPRHYLSKAKNGITIGEDTLDKRSMTPNNEIMNVDGKIIYVPAPVQSRMNFNSEIELATWTDAKPGAFAYVTTTKKAYRLIHLDTELESISQGVTQKNWYELLPNQTYHMEGNTPVPDPVWSPDWEGYPLEPDLEKYEWGSIGINDIDPGLVQFYWDTVWFNPDRTIGRYDGLLYQEGSRLLYNVYQTLDYDFPKNFLGTYYKSENLRDIVASVYPNTTAYVIETGTIWKYNDSEMWEDTRQTKREVFKTREVYKGDWSKLDPMKPYLAPNYAEKYLDYILEGTGWTVGEVDKIFIDNGTVEFGEDGVVHPEKIELSTYLYFDNSNAYNAINELCNAFKCYARFDHVNKKVSLKSIPGDDNNLIYQWRDNLATTKIVQDGEKAVSKLWVYGGEDTIGEVTIADCNRCNADYYLGDYISLQDLQTRAKPKEGDYAKVSIYHTWDELISQTLKNGQRLPIVNTFLVGELKVTSWGLGAIPTIQSQSQLPASGSLGQTVFIIDENSYWSWIPEANCWMDTRLDYEPKDDPLTPEDETQLRFEERYDYINGNWISKGQFYHWWEPLSPFADNYILNFDYFLDRKLITEEQIEDIKYNYVLPISKLNRKRSPLYKQRTRLNQELLNWNNTYDECKIARDAIDKSLRTSYAIYETGSDNLQAIVDLQVNAYPPGANLMKKGNNVVSAEGWVTAAIAYSESNAPVANSYTDINSVVPNPKIGDYVRVKNPEPKVYYYNKTFKFEDTIAAYLGWQESQVISGGPGSTKPVGKQFLTSPDGTKEARIRGEGLFQKLREEELWQDAERASIAPWYNPPANINEMPGGPIGDPKTTSTMYPYYSAQERYVTEQINMNDALDRIGAIETELTLVLEKIEKLEEQINKYEYGLREKYGDFLVEGVFTDDTMVWIYNLWYAGLKALNLYHRPLVTYNLDVVDISGLPEYRTVTSDIYHDIVYRMNKAELVLPNPGDYCYVTDNTLGLVRERANITSVTRCLSNPSQHKITIATVDTNTEDLIGKVVTAANTIYSKEQIYNRSAIIAKDGTIAVDKLAESLNDPSGKLAVMSNSGTVILGDNGITTVDRDDARNRMQYTGKGIFASTNGGVTWENIVNAGKISIKNLSAGSIDSNNISVTNIGKDVSVIINGEGISAINYTNNVNTAPSALPNDPHVSFFLDAKTGNAYFKGHIKSGSGEIGGWTLRPNYLYSGSGTKAVGLSSSGNSDYAFWAGANVDSISSAPFRVTRAGKLYATGADIQGAIKASSLTLDPNIKIPEGNVQNLYVYLKAGGPTIGTEPSSDTTGIKVSAQGLLTASNAVIYGTVYAKNGTFTGKITANDGKIGGWTIDGQNIKYGSTTVLNGSTGEINTSKLTASGGTIGGWTITGTQFKSKSGNTVLNSNGSISGATISGSSFSCSSNGTTRFKIDSSGDLFYYNGTGFLSCGKTSGTSHPWLSAVNVNYTNGISLRNGTGYGAAGTEIDYIRHSGTSMRIQSGGNMNIGTDGSQGVGFDCKRIRLGDKNTSIYVDDHEIPLYKGVSSDGWFECENTWGTPKLKFKNGIIIDYKTK